MAPPTPARFGTEADRATTSQPAAHSSHQGDNKHTEVQEIALDLPDPDYASKLDHSPELIDRLVQHGRQKSQHVRRTWAG